MTAPSFAARVVRWQRSHGRCGLPWQGTRDPYRVWLSEVMLQQTQVATVVDYYLRFLARFPTVQALAAAPLDEVLALWSGLGYYSRARNLHRCAQQVVVIHGGTFPATRDDLARLPGIGLSSAAAIAAFCHGERVAILDGNVKRVLARALGFEGDLALAAEQRRLWATAESLLPRRGMAEYTQGLMDLGATLCTLRRPDCPRCPLATRCVAHASGTPERLPIKSRRQQRGRRRHALLWLQHRDRMWLVQRPPQGVWAGLFSLPQTDSAAALEAATAQWPGQGRWLADIEHALTHFDWTLSLLAWRWPARSAPPELGPGRWVTRDEALALGLPAPIRRLLQAGVVAPARQPLEGTAPTPG
jgi:A/G-specific adenine glycosylase